MPRKPPLNCVAIHLLSIALVACGGSSLKSGSGSSKDGAGGLTLEVDRPTLRGAAEPSKLLQILSAQMAESQKGFQALGDEAPYFMSYQVTDRSTTSISASMGALMRSDRDRSRTLDVDVRVGDYTLDNTHPMRGDVFGSFERFRSQSWEIALEDDPAMIRPTLWLATNAVYRQARELYLKVKGNDAVKAEAEDQSDSFSREEPIKFYQAPVAVDLDREKWEGELRKYSQMFRSHPDVLESQVSLSVDAVNRYTATSEGSQTQLGRLHVRLSFYASTRAEDGMDLYRFDSIDVASLDRLPPESEIRAKIQQVIDDAIALRAAPLAEPYVGPAILEGEAAGVFFHEVFGHRVEGHRQKDEEEGQTFAKKVGKRVMPGFIDVYDDPTIRTLNGVELNGFYAVDDQAVMAQKAVLVEGGVLKGFLMSRSPTRGFVKSNGHGRRQEGRAVVARQGNLVVHPRSVVSPEQLKARLLQEVEKQGKEYGLRFTVVQGGFTNTMRYGTQTFKVLPVMIYKVYPDGREELIRGAGIDGTPLTSLTQIIAAADDVRSFNGHCGAESGFVPVSASSPSLLVGHVEISRSPSGKNRPPLLPPPGPEKSN